jgi:glycine/D-amino acid oxidase-like deaminating enzyme
MKHLLIIGAGITGLLTALRLHKDYKLTIIDSGLDPRINNHLGGATYSGLDARHISITETAPWTTESRHKLILTESRDGGWLCIPKDDLNDFEKQWISEFQKIASNSDAHKINTSSVIDLNRQGILEWEKLGKEYDFLKPIPDESVMPIICRSKEDLLDEFNFESSLDNRVKLHDGIELPQSLSPLNSRLNNLGKLGFFTLYGRSYQIKTICKNLITYLESQKVSFKWNEYFSKTDADLIIWCSGVTPETSLFLRQFNILLGGVIGCWVAIDNPGITQACKIYGPEPVNYINVTPIGSKLLMSGGYGFVGSRPYDESIKLAEPIMEAMVSEVKKWLPDSKIKEKAFCIRPATPSGIPTLFRNALNKTPIIFAVGHGAGGFTQASYTAKRVEEISN